MNFTDNNVTFKDILNAGIITGGPKIAKGKYKKDANNNITGNMPVVNAIDIDWLKAEVPGISDPITSTGQLLAIIGQVKQAIGVSDNENNKTLFEYVEQLEFNINEANSNLTELEENVSEQLLQILQDIGLLKQFNSNVYTKEQSDSKFLTKHQSLEDYATKEHVSEKISDIVGTVPESLSTLEKITTKLNDNDNVISSIKNTVSEKANSEDVYTKPEVDTKIDEIHDNMKEYAETEADTFIDIYKRLNDQDVAKINFGHSTPVYSDDGIGLENKIALDNTQKYGRPITKENVLVIPSKNELNNDARTYQYSSSGNGTYLDVLFNAIHALQVEVLKLKNSFNYGIQSETGTVTSVSHILNEAEAEAEPIWAVDESTLTKITTPNLILTIGKDHTLVPSNNVEPLSGILKITNSALLNYDLNLLLAETELINKIYIYITSTSLDIQFIMSNINNTNDNFVVNIGEIFNNTNISNIVKRYNIMLCIGKTIENTIDNVKTYDGYNFIWISISDYVSGENLYTGYLNINTNKLEVGLSNTCKLQNTYLPTKVTFINLSLYKYDIYTKLDPLYTEGYQYIDTVPSTKDFVYKAAHITIRGCSNYAQILSLKGQLLDRELVIDESTNKLYTKLHNRIIQISGGGNSEINDNTGMTTTELIELLEKNGIINVTENGSDNIELNSIGDITFIHQATGKKFKFEVNEEGNLHSTELSDFDEITKSNIVKVLNNETSNYTNIRGFIGSLGNRMLYTNDEDFNKKGDLGLYADRLKIGAIYAPNPYQSVYGCSHAYIELENTSDKDIPLNGFYIHYGYSLPDSPSTYKKLTLALNGYIPAGGTYLIRGKQYADKNQANVNILVDNYDIEWYDGDKLIDLTWHLNCAQTYLLTYGIPDNFSTSTEMWGILQDGNTSYRSFNSHFVDAVSINDCIKVNNKGTWYNNAWQMFKAPQKPDKVHYYDVIFKNMFELDPAKQAFQGWACIANATGTAGDKIYDSSRARNDKTTDYQYLSIEDDKIVFPKSNEEFDISRFTPKASYEHKNVCTDKTQIDLDKPNMVTVSFGINMNRTRCFNWISAGLFDEYIWIKKKSETKWNKFESYHDSKTDLDTSENPSISSLYPYRKSFGTYHNKYTNKYDSIESVVYDRIIGVFPGCNVKYTSHKCIIELYGNDNLSNPETWEYFVGRANSDGSPNNDHISEIFEFTVYPSTYVPRIFQTTDQQGFHWIEYQAWTAAANEINSVINNQQSENIVPVLINTGDMTQNGTRINEWLDYYNGGKNLFNHLEQMNVVGNNDLCNTNPEILGTGDDTGKSNSFYFHVFYCYEIDPEILPIITNSNLEKGKYIPSFYYFGNGTYSFVMFNSELTVVNCRDWFKQIKNNQVVNLYTGFTIKDKDHNDVVYDNSFTSIYTMLYRIFNKLQQNNTLSNTIVACHEMPFTVVTNANLTISKNIKNVDRSLSGSNTGSLVGSHCNVMNYFDAAGKGIYWFSRLLEHFNIKLVIGGHKHTYACTNRLRELYAYDNGTKFSNINGKMVMNETLEHDDAIFKLYYKKSNNDLRTTSAPDYEEIHSSKFPIMKQINSELGITDNNTVVFPYFAVESLDDGIVYAMCQATGYKLKSNKELPSANQKFSYIIPKTDNGATSDKPNIDQQYAMFTEIDLDPSVFNIYLYRIKNITKTAENNKESLFGQLEYSKLDCVYEFMKHEQRDEQTDIMYGKWVSDKQAMISIQH